MSVRSRFFRMSVAVLCKFFFPMPLFFARDMSIDDSDEQSSMSVTARTCVHDAVRAVETECLATDHDSCKLNRGKSKISKFLWTLYAKERNDKQDT